MILNYVRFWWIYFKYFFVYSVSLKEILKVSINYPGRSFWVYKFLKTIYPKYIPQFKYYIDEFGNVEPGKLVLGKSLWNSKLDKETKNFIKILNNDLVNDK